MRAFVKKHWPMLAALAGFLLIIWIVSAISLRYTQGKRIYALDDAYIHMAMAKNFVTRGVWGVTADGFTSSTSSPLWTLFIAVAYAAAGVNDTSPFFLALISACLVLLASYAVLSALQAPATANFLTLVALIVLTPLPALVFTGMEHALHTALTIAATFVAARLLASEGEHREPMGFGLLLALAPLLTASRFEAAFLVLVIALGFLLRHQWRRGALLGALGLLPVAAYALVSKLHGWPWLPTSVLLKSGFAAAGGMKELVWGLFHVASLNLSWGKHLVALILVALLVDRIRVGGKRRIWDVERVMTGIFVGTGVLHLALARVGWFFRYEAYLVALGVLVVGCHFRALRTLWEVVTTPGPQSRQGLLEGAATMVMILALYQTSVRGIDALQYTPRATANIFDQHYSMAMFIKRYYQHTTVALNDVGAVNYFADIHCLDLWGLATLEVAQLRLRGAYRSEEIARLAANNATRIALVYDPWLETLGGPPPTWTIVGQWQIGINVAAGSDTVSIYAVSTGETQSLSQRLTDFSGKLPPGVVESGLYLKSARSGGPLRPE